MIDEKKIREAADREARRYPWGSYDQYITRLNLFKKGVEWALGNLVHYANENADWRRVVLCEFKNKYTGSVRYGDMNLNDDDEYREFKRRVNSGSITRWFYISDLLKGGSNG